MSKMRRNPVTPPDFLADTPKLDDEVVEQPISPAEPSNAPRSVDYDLKGGNVPYTEKPKDLAKVMTADQTPLCPFCLSPKLEPISADNPWGRKWVCNACCTAFREPVTGRAA